jgi:hypothetical protein
LQNLPHTPTPGVGHNGTPDNPQGILQSQPQDEPFVTPAPDTSSGSIRTHGSILRNGPNRSRAESMATMTRRVDFSLGMRDMAPGDMPGDVFEEREAQLRQRAAVNRLNSPNRTSQEAGRSSLDTGRSSAINHGTGGSLHQTNSGSIRSRERPSHRNRFFSRLHTGPHDEEAAMPDIPEAATDSSKERLDSRSGITSPAAVRPDGVEPLEHLSRALPSAHRPGFGPPRRSHTDTETIEMHHIR